MTIQKFILTLFLLLPYLLRSQLPNISSTNSSHYCTGQQIQVKGNFFFSPPYSQGYPYDTTKVFLGIFECAVDSTSGPNLLSSTPDTVWVRIPPSYSPLSSDTILDLRVVRIYSGGYQDSSATFPINLSEPFVSIGYQDSSFCRRDTNPSPIVSVGVGGGTFSTTPSQSGLILDPFSGTIDLQASQPNPSYQVDFTTNHPGCPETISVQIEIKDPESSFASYSGDTILTRCATGTIISDTNGLVPAGGSFKVSSPNIILLDSLTGEIDLGASLPGTYTIDYVPQDSCWFPSQILLTINPLDSVSITYPIPAQGVVCQSIDSISPNFLYGYSGGQYYADSSGLSFGNGGTFFPSQSAVGIPYNIYYQTIGNCPTDILVGQVTIGEEHNPWFNLADSVFCPDDPVFSIDSMAHPFGVFYVVQNLDTVAVLNSSYSIPSQLSPGSYTLHRTTPPPCPQTHYVQFEVIEENAGFYYPNPPFCQSLGIINPILTGTPGGIYWSNPNVSIVSSTGEIDLQASTPGPQTIYYQTPGICPAIDSVTIFIEDNPSAQFTYPSSEFCIPSDSTIPTVVFPGGEFSADPPWLVIDSATGEIDLAISLPGSYDITYELPGCNEFQRQTIELLQTDTTISIQIPQDSFCETYPPFYSSIDFDSSLGSPLGTWFLESGGQSPTPLGAGYIIPANLVDGTHIISYRVLSCGVDASKVITKLSTPSLAVTYPDSQFCISQLSLAPNIVISNGDGFHFQSSSNGLEMSVDSGIIDLGNSIPGDYQVSIETIGFCPTTITRRIKIFDTPQWSINVEPDTFICEGEEVEASMFLTNIDEYELLIGGGALLIQGNLTTSFSPELGDTLLGWAESVDGCMDTIAIPFSVAPKPKVLPIDSLQFSLGEEELSVSIMNEVDSSDILWSIQTQVETLLSDSLLRVPSGEVIDIQIPVFTNYSHSPIPISIEINSQTASCFGDTVILSGVLLPSPKSIFIPEAFTPNGDGFNDTWGIRWSDEILPENYEVRLFNRSNGQVASISPLQSGWDGSNLPDGVYSWILLDDRRIPIDHGGLTIRRK